jgi:lysophospholipase L1-like esterase
MLLARLLRIVCIASLFLLLAPNGWTRAQPTAAPGWVSTWGAAPDSPGPALPPQSIRQVVRISVGGAHVRIRLSNLYGTAPLTIGAAHIGVFDGVHEGGASIRPGSGRALTFGGSASVTIAPGASAVSDDAALAVAPLQELAVSLYLPAGAEKSTIHGAAMQTAFVFPREDRSGATVFPAGATDDSRYFLTDVEVGTSMQADAGTRAIVVVGDSIADGVGSTDDRNARWPDVLASMLRETPSQPPVAVVNSGIAGNRILRDAAKPFVGASTLARFERDALNKPGVRWIVLAHGINDIVASDMLADPAQGASADDIIAGMRSLVRRAHDRGVAIIGATLLPLGGVRRPFVYTPEAEAKRQAVNAWIRDSGAFDAVLDADRLLRDPAQPERLLPRYDSGDHLHPNDAGYRELAAGAHAAWKRLAAR